MSFKRITSFFDLDKPGAKVIIWQRCCRVKRCSNSSAGIMSAYDDMLNLQYTYSVLYDRVGIGVVSVIAISHVSVNKDIS